MITHKKTIRVMGIFVIISLVIVTILEFKVDKYVVNNWGTVFTGHRNFIINISMGVFTSSLLTCIISIISYCIERRKNYRILMDKIFLLDVETDYLHRLLLKCKEENNENLFNIFSQTLSNYLNAQKDVAGIINEICFIISNSILVEKFSTEFRNSLDEYNDLFKELYIATIMAKATFVRIFTSVTNDDRDGFYQEYNKQLQEITNFFGNDNKFHKSYEKLNINIQNKLNIKPDNIKK